jgi:hypothetical protein
MQTLNLNVSRASLFNNKLQFQGRGLVDTCLLSQQCSRNMATDSTTARNGHLQGSGPPGGGRRTGDEAESVYGKPESGSGLRCSTLKVAMALMTVFFVLASIAQVSFVKL